MNKNKSLKINNPKQIESISGLKITYCGMVHRDYGNTYCFKFRNPSTGAIAAAFIHDMIYYGVGDIELFQIDFGTDIGFWRMAYYPIELLLDINTFGNFLNRDVWLIPSHDSFRPYRHSAFYQPGLQIYGQTVTPAP